MNEGLVLRLLGAVLLLWASHVWAADARDVARGRTLFQRHWISSNSASNGGLGPLFDATSCSSCHGAEVTQRALGSGVVVRLGSFAGRPDPVYGSQLQLSAISALAPEAHAQIHWLAEGALQAPDVAISHLAYGDVAGETHAAIRRAPALSGVAQLDAIPDAEILRQAGVERQRGMRGRPDWVTDASGHGRVARWGWKAAEANLEGQVESALQRDVGLSTSAYPGAWGECTPAEAACRLAALKGTRGPVEVPNSLRDLLVTYLRSVPSPPGLDRKAAGFAIFERVGCDGCHANLKNRQGETVPAYTDLLLHDMGPRLDDGIAEGGAKSSEWRTAPLWNIAGDLKAGGLMHDGRARTIAEAIEWHGGEAWRARLQFDTLPEAQKNALEKFLAGAK